MRSDNREVNAILNASLLTKDGVETRDIICNKGVVSDIRKSSIKHADLAPPVYNAKKRIVVPGFIDCHVHLFGVALNEITLDLSGCRSIQEMQQRMENQTAKLGRINDEGWMIGRGWDQDLFKERRFPNREDIDSVTGTRPALMVRICGHIGVVNSAAIRKISGLRKYSSELVPRSRDGEIDGLVKEGALDHIWRDIPPAPEELLAKLFDHAQQKALSAGLIGVHCILSENWKSELNVLKILDNSGRLILKTTVLLPIDSLQIVEKMKLEIRKMKLNGQNFATIGFKLFADGSLGARTAAMITPYSDDLSNSGILYRDTGYVTEIAKRVKRLRMVLATHAIGDRAVKQVVEAYKKAGITKRDGFRIEHSSVLNMKLLQQLDNVVISVQPSFIASDYWLSERLGRSKNRFAYPLKTLLKLKGIDLVGGSDSPVESLSPLRGICAAMENPMEGESLTFREALKLYTLNAAGKSPLTRLTGALKRGMRCSLSVLDCSDPEQIGSSGISTVLIDGKVEFQK